MNGFVISGIQQVGIGVMNVSEAWNWYMKYFGMDCRIFEDVAVAEYMLPYTGGQPRSRHAVLAVNLQSGGGFEIWQYTERKPEKIKEEIRIGDLGIIACKIKAKNLQKTLSGFDANGLPVPAGPSSDPSGEMSFFLKDPYGNMFQVMEAADWFRNEKKDTGGAYGAIIGVKDIERSRVVYSDILGYNEVVYDKTGTFSDLKSIPGGDKPCRRVLLKRSEKFKGAFTRIFGDSRIELISTMECGKPIYQGRFWGDPGFIHLCFDIQGMNEMENHCRKMGFPFTVDSRVRLEGNSFDMGH